MLNKARKFDGMVIKNKDMMKMGVGKDVFF